MCALNTSVCTRVRMLGSSRQTGSDPQLLLLLLLRKGKKSRSAESTNHEEQQEDATEHECALFGTLCVFWSRRAHREDEETLDLRA